MRQATTEQAKTVVSYYLPRWLKEHIDALAVVRRTNKSYEAERLLREAIDAARDKERKS
jgi:hypothetical protein